MSAGVTPRSVSDSIEGLTHLIHEPAALLLVATVDDQIVGSVIGGWDGWRGNIYRLAVTPEHRRKGIGRRLVAEISRELFAKGATRLSALVEHEHQQAIDFWESVKDLGYARDPKFARYIADRSDDLAEQRRRTSVHIAVRRNLVSGKNVAAIPPVLNDLLIVRTPVHCR